MIPELSYWIAIAHLNGIKTRRKNEILVRLFDQGQPLSEFFHLSPTAWKIEFHLSELEVMQFKESVSQLSNHAFMAEDLLEQGYNILPITSGEYSPTLKRNLGRSAPPVLYIKGRTQLLQEDSIAIIGTRKASNRSLAFADTIAKKASQEYKVVISGFARGVDQQALESAIRHQGQSIIVLPQGITTFGMGFRKYYREIVDGNVLVLSCFHPKAPWSAQLAMARNPLIYGLASDIYVAESNETGGTWSGAIDGLRRGRVIYVRSPGLEEKNANDVLISKGAAAVDESGNML